MTTRSAIPVRRADRCEVERYLENFQRGVRGDISVAEIAAFEALTCTQMELLLTAGAHRIRTESREILRSLFGSVASGGITAIASCALISPEAGCLFMFQQGYQPTTSNAPTLHRPLRLSQRLAGHAEEDKQ